MKPSMRRLALPYAIVVLDYGRVVLLNRVYRQLGQDRVGEHMSEADYLQYLGQHARKYAGLTRLQLDKIVREPMRRDQGKEYSIGWLYADGSVPTRSKAHWAMYSERLAKLAKFGE